MEHVPLFEVLRGPVVESIHFGSVAVADSRGELLAWAGDPSGTTFMRSSAKPFQALPLVYTGAMDAYDLDLEELAVICGSHRGTDEHVRAVASIQQKAGFQQTDLQCGAVFPGDESTRRRMRQAGQAPAPNRHNCSGKHSGMLALAQHLNAAVDEYLNQEHPVQRLMLESLARMTGLSPVDIQIGVDGCSAPNFALPLTSAATAYARLLDPGPLSSEMADACLRIRRAMTGHPAMVSGPGRFDTELMKAAGEGLIAKGGAEGFQGIGIPPGRLSLTGGGVGIAIKISDGDARQRAGAPIILSVLAQLGALSGESARAMAHFQDRPVLNDRGMAVGRGRVAFELSKGVGRP